MKLLAKRNPIILVIGVALLLAGSNMLVYGVAESDFGAPTQPTQTNTQGLTGLTASAPQPPPANEPEPTPPPSPAPAPSDGSYVDSTNGFSIMPPSGWTQTNPSGKVSFTKGEVVIDVFARDSAGKSVDDAASDISREGGSILISKKESTLGGIEARKTTFERPDGRRGLGWFAIRNSKVYVVLYTAPQGSYLLYEADASRTAGSFKFL